MVRISDGTFLLAISFFLAPCMYFLLPECKNTYDVTEMSEQSRCQFIHSHKVLLPLLLLLCDAILLLLQQQCCCFLLLFVIVCPMAKFGAGALNLIPVSYLSPFKRDLFLMCPLAVLYCVAFTVSSCPHPRQLRACPESRRTSARRG